MRMPADVSSECWPPASSRRSAKLSLITSVILRPLSAPLPACCRHSTKLPLSGSPPAWRNSLSSCITPLADHLPAVYSMAASVDCSFCGFSNRQLLCDAAALRLAPSRGAAASPMYFHVSNLQSGRKICRRDRGRGVKAWVKFLGWIVTAIGDGAYTITGRRSVSTTTADFEGCTSFHVYSLSKPEEVISISAFCVACTVSPANSAPTSPGSIVSSAPS